MILLFQIVMILIACGLIVNVFWGNIASLWKSKKTVKSVQSIHDNHRHHCNNLADIVNCWSHLKDCCETQGLKEAATELEKIFPLLIVKTEVKSEVSKTLPEQEINNLIELLIASKNRS
jgi:hypothetical protein